MNYNTMGQRIRHAVYLIKNKPKKAMWLTLIGLIASYLAERWCGSFMLIYILLSIGISTGTSLLALKTVRNEEVSPSDLFAAFKDFRTAKHVIGGQLWSLLVISVWLIIPEIALMVLSFSLGIDVSALRISDYESPAYWGRMGLNAAFMMIAMLVTCVFAVIFIVKVIELSFVQFILVTRDDVGTFEAWKESKRLTYGLKGRIFGFVFIPALIFGFISGILYALSRIPIVGSMFMVLMTVLILFAIVILPYYYNLGLAGFYEASLHAPKIVYQYQSYQNPDYHNPDYPAPDYNASDHSAPDHNAPDHNAPDHNATDHNAPAPNQPPVMEQPPIAEHTPATNQPPAAEQSSVSEQIPATNQPPAIDQPPAAEQIPAPEAATEAATESVPESPAPDPENESASAPEDTPSDNSDSESADGDISG